MDSGQTSGGERRAAFRISRQIVLAALFLALCMWGFIGWSIRLEYHSATDQARTQSRNLVIALASELRQTLRNVGHGVRMLEHEISAAPKSMPLDTAIRRAGDTAVAYLGVDGDLRLADADGRIVFSSRLDDPAGGSIAADPAFQRYRADPGAPVAIQPDPRPGPPRITVTAPLRTPDGRFLGVAIRSLRAASLLTQQREFDLGQQGRVAIVTPAGRVLAGFDRSAQDGSAGAGLDLSGGPWPADLQAGETHLYTRSGRVDDTLRLIAVRRLRDFDIDVLVALSCQEVFAPVHVHVLLLALLGVGVTLLIAVLTGLLVREVWRRIRREAELAADRERLQQAQAQIDLERTRLAETNRELIVSKERAEIANRTKSQFLAHMSHELRTPLHAIIGFSELIVDQAPTGPRMPPLADYANDILTSGRHLLDLINTILDITKIESGTASLSESIVVLADAIRNAIVTIKAQADQRQIGIEVRLPEEPIRLIADRTRIIQVLINLLSNAVKFTQENGHVLVSAGYTAEGDVAISVIDTGIGMSESEILVALEPFGQVDSALSRSYQGTGLGLPLAARLVELHGGRLDVSSIKGKGTAVHVILPSQRITQRSGVSA